jgi:glyoxylate/hydroxypyruvate reductase A
MTMTFKGVKSPAKTAPGPILVYSTYAADLGKVRTLLTQDLPGVAINYASSPNEAEPYLHDAEILYAWGFPSRLLSRMARLRWVQKMGAGVDDILTGGEFPSGVVLTRTDGRLIAAPMVEYVLAMAIGQTLQLTRARQQQADNRWDFFSVNSIRQSRIGIAGLGEIGSEIAAAFRSLGCDVIGWRRSDSPSDVVQGLFAGKGALKSFVSQCDVLVLVLPLTHETAGLFGREILSQMKMGAHLINVGRGGVLDETALLHTIGSGRIGRASLDVFETEPLPRDHPFWNHPRIDVTPHICGPLLPDDVVPHFLENYRAYAAGGPLRHMVNLDRQY